MIFIAKLEKYAYKVSECLINKVTFKKNIFYTTIELKILSGKLKDEKIRCTHQEIRITCKVKMRQFDAKKCAKLH